MTCFMRPIPEEVWSNLEASGLLGWRSPGSELGHENIGTYEAPELAKEVAKGSRQVGTPANWHWTTTLPTCTFGWAKGRGRM